MPFIRAPNGKGLFYVPDDEGRPKKHPCPDCTFCLMCNEHRCLDCRRQKAETGDSPCHGTCGKATGNADA